METYSEDIERDLLYRLALAAKDSEVEIYEDDLCTFITKFIEDSCNKVDEGIDDLGFYTVVAPVIPSDSHIFYVKFKKECLFKCYYYNNNFFINEDDLLKKHYLKTHTCEVHHA